MRKWYFRKHIKCAFSLKLYSDLKFGNLKHHTAEMVDLRLMNQLYSLVAVIR